MNVPFSFIVATSETIGRNIAVSLRCDNVALESEYFDGVPEGPGLRTQAVESRCRPLHQETTFILIVERSLLEDHVGLMQQVRRKLFGEKTPFLARAAAVQWTGSDEAYLLMRSKTADYGPHHIRDDLPGGVEPPPGRPYIP